MKKTIVLFIGVIIMMFVFNYETSIVSVPSKNTSEQTQLSSKASTLFTFCDTNITYMYIHTIIKMCGMNTFMSCFITSFSSEKVNNEYKNALTSINVTQVPMDDTS